MRPLINKLKPARGFSTIFHNGLLVLLPFVLFVVRQFGTQFVVISLVLVLLSKWRMFAVRPRFWFTLIRANAVDLMVGFSVVVFMLHAGSVGLQLAWAVLYAGWLLFLKPAAGILPISAQAFIGQLVGLLALFLVGATVPTVFLVLGTGVICATAARHFFDSFDEPYSKMLAYLWGYFAAGLTWILSHWLLYYGPIAQPVVLLSTVGYGVAALYYFDHNGKLSVLLRRQFVFIMLAIVIVIITFSDWGDKVV
jgi:hypothetical protein